MFQNFTYINLNEFGEQIQTPATEKVVPAHRSTLSATIPSNSIGAYTSNKLIRDVSQKKLNINILKNKVKIVENKEINNSCNNNLSNVNNNSSVNACNSGRVNYNYANQKIAQNVKSLYNNYLNNNHARSYSNSISSNSIVTNNTKYAPSPYREKKSTSQIVEPIAGSTGSSAGLGSYVSKNMNYGSTSTSNIFQRNVVNSKLPNISNLEKLKLTKKLTGSSSTSTIFKNYKQSANSQNTTGSSVGSSLKFFNK